MMRCTWSTRGPYTCLVCDEVAPPTQGWQRDLLLRPLRHPAARLLLLFAGRHAALGKAGGVLRCLHDDGEHGQQQSCDPWC